MRFVEELGLQTFVFQHKLEISSQSRCSSALRLLYISQIVLFCTRSRCVSGTFGTDSEEWAGWVHL